MNKLERKFGKYAIPNLSLILIICYGVGFLFQMIPALSGILNYLTLNPYFIARGQVWRLVTWIIIPPYQFDILTLITLFFYYSIGHTLERVWGDWFYNIYIFSGMLFTIIGTFVIWGILYFIPSARIINGVSYDVSLIPLLLETIARTSVSTYYVNMSILLAFAATFPYMQVLLMFILPLKIKWLGIGYAALLVYEFIVSSFFYRIIIIASVMNFLVFFFIIRKRKFGSPKQRFQQTQRRQAYEKNVRQATSSISKHKCAICGRTEISNPDLEFRFCSKCNGNYEYCSEHLFTHKHVE